MSSGANKKEASRLKLMKTWLMETGNLSLGMDDG